MYFSYLVLFEKNKHFNKSVLFSFLSGKNPEQSKGSLMFGQASTVPGLWYMSCIKCTKDSF